VLKTDAPGFRYGFAASREHFSCSGMYCILGGGFARFVRRIYSFCGRRAFRRRILRSPDTLAGESHRLVISLQVESLETNGPIFGFETDFAGTLRCIPMSVRFKLDQCRVKLTLKQWNRIPPTQRLQLVSEPCGAPENVDSFKSLLVELIETWTSSGVENMPADPAPAWADTIDTPHRIVAYAIALGVAPPSADQWATLAPLQRYALFKLTRPGHDNDNFIPAMREFGLL
jgi:hypothetical protein